MNLLFSYTVLKLQAIYSAKNLSCLITVVRCTYSYLHYTQKAHIFTKILRNLKKTYTTDSNVLNEKKVGLGEVKIVVKHISW